MLTGRLCVVLVTRVESQHLLWSHSHCRTARSFPFPCRLKTFPTPFAMSVPEGLSSWTYLGRHGQLLVSLPGTQLFTPFRRHVHSAPYAVPSATRTCICYQMLSASVSPSGWER